MQFEVVWFLVGPEASKDQSQTWANAFWRQQPPSITVKLSKSMVVSCHENLVELVFVVWNLSSGLKLPEFRVAPAWTGPVERKNWHEKKMVFLCLLAKSALLPTSFPWRPFFQHVGRCWKVPWLDHFVLRFHHPLRPSGPWSFQDIGGISTKISTRTLPWKWKNMPRMKGN